MGSFPIEITSYRQLFYPYFFSIEVVLVNNFDLAVALAFDELYD